MVYEAKAKIIYPSKESPATVKKEIRNYIENSNMPFVLTDETGISFTGTIGKLEVVVNVSKTSSIAGPILTEEARVRYKANHRKGAVKILSRIAKACA